MSDTCAAIRVAPLRDTASSTQARTDSAGADGPDNPGAGRAPRSLDPANRDPTAAELQHHPIRPAGLAPEQRRQASVAAGGRVNAHVVGVADRGYRGSTTPGSQPWPSQSQHGLAS